MENQDLIKVFSIFEGDFSIDWIEGLTGKKTSEILFALEKGIRDGLLIRKASGIYFFKNSKKKKDCFDSLSSSEKEHLHELIVGRLIQDLPDDENKVRILAYHLLHISNDLDRCKWLLKAGNIYRKSFRNERALQCYSKAIKDLKNLSGEEIDPLFIETAINYSKISTARHDTSWVLSVLQEAMVRAERSNNQAFMGLLKMHMAKNEWLRSQYLSAMKYFEEGWSSVKNLGNPKIQRSAIIFRTFFLYWQGLFKKAIDIYEKSIPDVEKFPTSRFPLLAGQTLGHCYVCVGMVTQGFGMLDAIHKYCLKKGEKSLAAQAEVSLGISMINTNRISIAIQYLEHSMEDRTQDPYEWFQILGKLALAYAYYLNQENTRCVALIKTFLEQSSTINITAWPHPYLMDLAWAVEQGRLPKISGLSLVKEIEQNINGENIFMRGVAYRYQALMQRREKIPSEKIMQTLHLSLTYLQDSGHQIELGKSQLELSREYLSLRERGKAKEVALEASKTLFSFNEGLFPDDLRSLIKDSSDSETLLNEIMKLGQEVVTIRDKRELSHSILSTVNRITGAERGAIFLFDNSLNPPALQLRSSKSLTSEQIKDPSFSSSMKMIEQVAFTKKSLILETEEAENQNHPFNDIIRSRICVPLIFSEKVIGVLYHDNRLLNNAFKQSDLEILAYFAAQAAIAMDNARAYEEIQRLNQKLNEEKKYFEEQHLQSLHFEDIVGESPAILRVLEKANQVAKTDTTVLIMGETGVGKELVARAIHRQSLRCNKPFIRVLCSALPDSLIPSELFGHERGAFTGATHRRIGRFELADGGTLFLDEIAEIPLEIQVRLLRVLQSKEFERVGGNETLRSNFRLLVATNRDLEKEVNAQRFRADLYYRLNIFPIYVDPLRGRKEDIPMLASYFLRVYAQKMGKVFDGIPKSEMDKLIHYAWPGNIRELENIIERSTILSPGGALQIPELVVNQEGIPHLGDETTLDGNERRHILWALQKTHWKVRGLGGAAELLKIHPSTLAFRMKKLGIQRPLKFSRRKKESI